MGRPYKNGNHNRLACVSDRTVAYNATVRRLIHYMLLACLAGVALLPACHKRAHLPDTGGLSGQPARDELLYGLEGSNADQRQFAMLFITRFKLAGYEQPLAKLAQDDPIAGVALAAVYSDAKPVLGWYGRQRDQSRALNAVLGALLGLRCAQAAPPALWDGLIAGAPPAQRVDLLWGVAQLDVEPGGPVKLSDQSRAQLQAEAAALSPTLGLEQRAAYDAALGGTAGHTINWDEYAAQAGRLPLTGTQWAALLRWGQPEQWTRMLRGAGAAGSASQPLAAAAAQAAPKGVKLPWTPEQCRQAGMETECIACKLSELQEQAVAIKVFDNLAAPPATKASSDKAAAEQAPELTREQAAGLRLLSYAAARRDADAVSYVLGLAPRMAPNVRSAVLATLDSRGADLVTDAQLQSLIDLAHADIAYWLVIGWPDRAPVAASRMPALVRVTPGQENAMLVYAYRLHQAQQKLSKDG
jgi:hypothetical protein